MMARVYVETSIVSYLRQKPSGQVVAAARQLLTRRWWEEQRKEYELVTSQFVLDEAADGAPALAQERLKLLVGIPLLELSTEIGEIAADILKSTSLPSKAQVDALHIAVAAHHRVDYLLTWNCTHLANARILPKLRNVLSDRGCFVPLICTPQEMVGIDHDEEQ